MPTTVWPSIRSHVVRATKNDACGAPVIGPKSTIVSDGHISIKVSPQFEDGEETAPKNAAGKIAFLKVDPELFNMVTGQPIVLDHAGNATGIRIGATIRSNFGIETWSDVPGTACGPDGKLYGYALLPWLKDGRLGDFSFENALANFTITARTEANSPWGVGPYDVVLNAPVSPSTTPLAGPLLTPIAADQHIHMEPTSIIYPATTAGAVALAP